MSLKTFHIFFIACSALLAFGIGVWCLSSFLHGGGSLNAILGALGILAGIGLILYGIAFLRKLRDVGFMALACLAIPRLAEACQACWGDPSSPQVKGMQAAIWVLLGITGFVMAGFVSLFFYFWKRGRKVALDNALIVQQMMEASQK